MSRDAASNVSGWIAAILAVLLAPRAFFWWGGDLGRWLGAPETPGVSGTEATGSAPAPADATTEGATK
ncbi:hypothetical protein [Oceaniglobus roseus]|uniref:hypothetical protein n=1 Tax=Oceaniglobus roseus TaxID=1737570 RepID=UPI0012FFDBD0|nr:hypothetical protein [Kandeliimicrobium roseum]